MSFSTCNNCDNKFFSSFRSCPRCGWINYKGRMGKLPTKGHGKFIIDNNNSGCLVITLVLCCPALKAANKEGLLTEDILIPIIINNKRCPICGEVFEIHRRVE